MIYWMTGLSGSGKTTLAKSTDLINLDGDEFRNTLNSDLGFSMEDREENIRRIAYIAKILNDQGNDIIVSTISPTDKIRDIAKNIIGENQFTLIFIKADLDVCINRDPKGIYKKKLNNMTGIDSKFETPLSPDLVVDTTLPFVECSKILNKVVYKNVRNFKRND